MHPRDSSAGKPLQLFSWHVSADKLGDFSCGVLQLLLLWDFTCRMAAEGAHLVRSLGFFHKCGSLDLYAPEVLEIPHCINSRGLHIDEIGTLVALGPCSLGQAIVDEPGLGCGRQFAHHHWPVNADRISMDHSALRFWIARWLICRRCGDIMLYGEGKGAPLGLKDMASILGPNCYCFRLGQCFMQRAS